MRRKLTIILPTAVFLVLLAIMASCFIEMEKMKLTKSQEHRARLAINYEYMAEHAKYRAEEARALASARYARLTAALIAITIGGPLLLGLIAIICNA
jgi:hypothetical protein